MMLNDEIKRTIRVIRANRHVFGPALFQRLVAGGNAAHHDCTPAGNHVHSFIEVLGDLAVEVVFTFGVGDNLGVCAHSVVNVYSNNGTVVCVHGASVDPLPWLPMLTYANEVADYEVLVNSIDDKLHTAYYDDVDRANQLTGLHVQRVDVPGFAFFTEVQRDALQVDACALTRALVVREDTGDGGHRALDALVAARRAREQLCPRLKRIQTFDDVVVELESYGLSGFKVMHSDADCLIVQFGKLRQSAIFIKDEFDRPLLLSNHEYRNVTCDLKLNSKLNKFFNATSRPSLKRMNIVQTLSGEA